MKKILFILLTICTCAVATAQQVLPRPNPPRLVTDVAGVLSAAEQAALEQKLVALDDSTSNQIAVVLVKTIGDVGIEDYAVKLFREWGIGNAKTNNGVLIIAAIDDHKVWIEVGYGLEGAIPDITASAIYRNDIVPAFRRNEYYQGLDAAINDLAKAAVGEYKTARSKNPSKSPGGGIIIFLILLFVVIMIVSRGGGGGGRGRGGGLGSIANAIILSSLMNSGNRNSGGWGGGGFGGGGGGGGFGGFGGGSAGGGGAGGSW